MRNHLTEKMIKQTKRDTLTGPTNMQILALSRSTKKSLKFVCASPIKSLMIFEKKGEVFFLGQQSIPKSVFHTFVCSVTSEKFECIRE